MLRGILSRPRYIPHHGLNRREPRLRAQARYVHSSRPAGRPAPSKSATTQETPRQKTVRYLFKPWAAQPLSSRSDNIGFYARVTTSTVLAFIAWHTFSTYFYATELTYGISMLPSLAATGDSVLISKYYRRGRDLFVGDVVSFKHPVKIGEYAVKRILGMPGDFVEVNVDGTGRRQVLQVPEGHCWIEGDNQRWSRDSRVFGPLPLGLVTGKVVAKCRGWRFWEWELVENLVKPAQDTSSDLG